MSFTGFYTEAEPNLDSLVLSSLFATSKRSAIIVVYSGVTRQSSFGIRNYSCALAVVYHFRY